MLACVINFLDFPPHIPDADASKFQIGRQRSRIWLESTRVGLRFLKLQHFLFVFQKVYKDLKPTCFSAVIFLAWSQAFIRFNISQFQNFFTKF
jgi:hypothetical protein